MPPHDLDGVRHSKPNAKLCDHLGFAVALVAQSVIDRRGFDEAWPRGGCEQQQSHAVRTTGYCNPDVHFRRDQRIEIPREPLNNCSIDFQALLRRCE
jgi:hypothetical protein